MKSEAMTRTFISAAVDKGFKDIARDPKRSVRQLVDLGTFFAKGRFQKYFFDIFGEMLHNERSSYYQWIHDLVVEADQKQLKTFGMNMAYNSWTVGAKTVRALEQNAGFNVPWTLVFRLDAGGVLTESELDSVVVQGKEMGVFTYIFLCGESYDPQQLLPLLRHHPDCAFLLFLQPQQVDEPLTGAMLEVQNTLACIRCDVEGFQDKSALLHSRHCFFAAWCAYSAEDAVERIQTQLMPQVLRAQTPFFFFRAQDDCPETVQRRVRAYTVESRQAQRDPVFCVDFWSDLAFIDDVISSNACVLSFDRDGVAVPVPGSVLRQPFGLRGMALRTLLSQFLPHCPAPAGSN